MEKTILFEIVTPERLLLSEEVDEVTLPGVMGEFGVLPGHTPLLTGVKIGVCHFRRGDKVEYYAINEGTVEVLPEKVILLTQTAESRNEIDLTRAEAARRRAEERLKERKENIDIARAMAALDRAKARIKAVQM